MSNSGLLKFRKDKDLLKRVQQWATEMMAGLEHTRKHEERLRDLGLFNLEKAERGLITVYKYLKHRSQVDRDRLFSVACSNGTRSNGHKLEHGKFYTNTKKNFFTVKALEQAARRSCGVPFSGDI